MTFTTRVLEARASFSLLIDIFIVYNPEANRFPTAASEEQTLLGVAQLVGVILYVLN